MRGFSSAEGCFFVNLFKSESSKLKMKVQLVFYLTQHSRDEKLIQSFVYFFDCGYVIQNRACVEFRVTKYRDITEKVIPIFQKYPIYGVKALDFAD